MAATLDVAGGSASPAEPGADGARAQCFRLVLLAHCTITRSFAALFISLAVGIALATVFTLSRAINDMFSPLFVVLQIIPKMALAPLFVVWFGTGRLVAPQFCRLPQLFPDLTGCAANSRKPARMPRGYAARSAPRPGELSFTSNWRWRCAAFVGAKVSATLSIIGVVLGEFVSARAGIGWYIVQAAALSQTAISFPSLVG